jgi:glutamyl-Q tRNA(Asp) synthetase
MRHSLFNIQHSLFTIPTTRFAPSPTGELHLGHAYAAKVAHDLAREHNGHFLLRHEDIDSSRVRDEYYSQIEEDLRWLGLNWDGEILRQTDRQDAYREALEKLKQQGLVYPCFCTRKDIQQSLSAPHGAAEHIYPGTCRNLPKEESDQRIANGDAHAWRFDSMKAAAIHGELSFHDLRFGKTQVNPLANGDAVLARKDIGIAYHLAVVVDDAFQNITHVTRGDDLLESTHIHRQLQAVLKLPEPTYLHHRCICDETGKRLAKRDDARSISTLREQGFTTEAVLDMANV